MSSYTQNTAKYSSSSRGQSSTSGGSSLKGYSDHIRRSRIFLSSLLYNVQLHTSNAFPWLRILLYFIEMLQIISIPLEFAFTSFGNQTVDNGLYYFERLRMVMPPVADTTAQTAVLSIVIIYLGLVLAVALRLGFLLSEGSPGHTNWLFGWGICTILIQQVIYLPILSMLFSVLQCGIVHVRGDNLSDYNLSGLHNSYAERFPNFLVDAQCPSSQSYTFIALAAICIVVTVIMFLIFALAMPGYDQHRKSSHQWFAMSFCRIPFFLFLIKTIATFYIQFSGPIKFGLRTGLFHWGLILAFAALTVHVLYYLPFYKRQTNYLYASFFAISFWAALSAFIASHTSEQFHVFIAFIVIIIPVIVGTIATCHLRSRPYYDLTSWQNGLSRQTFNKSFEVELYTRPFSVPRDKDQTKLYQETVIGIFWRGMQQFTTDLGMRLSLMQYLLEDKGNFQLLTSVAEKVKSPATSADMKFLLFSIEKHRIALALSMDGGAEEISKNIQRANSHAGKAKILIKSFWESLLHEEELMLLPTIVAKLEREETKADILFKKLRNRFPDNPAVLRHYAQFLDEVKNDSDEAMVFFKQADDIETDIASRHSHSHSQQGQTRSHRQDRNAGSESDIQTDEDSSGNRQSNVTFPGLELETISRARRRKKREKKERGPRKSDAEMLPTSPSPSRNIDESIPVSKIESGFVAKDHSVPSVRRMTKLELIRYRRYRTQAESSRSHSVWKITYAINLTLLILLINMVIVFGSTMGILSNQQNAVDQLTDVVNTRTSVAISVSSTLRATRIIATGDNSTFQEDIDRMLNLTTQIEDSAVSILKRKESYGPVRDGWSDSVYPVYTWSPTKYWMTGQGYINSTLNALDTVGQFTFWMHETARVLRTPNRGALGLWNSTSGRFIMDNGLTGTFDSLWTIVNLYQEKSNATIRTLRDITAALLPFSFFLLLVLVWFLLRASIREIQKERVSILRLFLGIPKDNILAIVGHIRSGDLGDLDEDDLFAADEDEVSTFTATVDLQGEARAGQEQTVFWVLKNTRLSMLRTFFLRFVVSLVLVFVLVLVASSIVLASVQDFRTTVSELNLAGQRRTVLGHLQASTLTLTYYDEMARVYPEFDPNSVISPPNQLRGFMRQDLDTISSVNYDLNYGVDGKGGINNHPYLVDMTYHNESCQPIHNYSYTCTGTNSLLVYITALANVILAFPDSQLGYNTTQLLTFSDIAFEQLGPLYLVAVNYYREKAYEVIRQVRTAVIVTFVLIFPVLVAVNFLLRPMANQIKQEHQRTLRMLLMIPLNVIDNTPSIKEYLDSLLRDSGRTPWYRHKAKKGHKQEERLMISHEPLLQAVVRESEESLLVISTEGTVEMCNPASERLFKYEKRNIVGHHISTIFTEQASDEISMRILMHRRMAPSASMAPASEPATLISAKSAAALAAQLGAPPAQESEEAAVREQLELVGQRSDGEIFPIAVTLSQFKVNSKVYYGVYIRDITYTKNMELQVEKERDMLSSEKKKLNGLLLNVFPKTIAEQLLNKGDEYQPHLIAEEYKEASILFADIVGFTTMCSDLEPAVLLLILDGIFSEWDILVEKYHLQKIKTIGDCFMVAGGVPDRMVDHVERMIDFALEMIETLHKYNEFCALLKTRSLALNLRVGINTGPVVAGIIGRSRICFDLWGDAVNVASRMESTSIVGRIQVSQPVFNRVKNKYEFEERGSIEVKGKGAMLTYLLVAPRFKRTNSGKVIDLRFASHLQNIKSGITEKPVEFHTPSHPLASIMSPSANHHSSPHHTPSSTPHHNLAVSLPSSPASIPLPPTPSSVPLPSLASSPSILKNPYKDPNNKDGPRPDREGSGHSVAFKNLRLDDESPRHLANNNMNNNMNNNNMNNNNINSNANNSNNNNI